MNIIERYFRGKGAWGSWLLEPDRLEYELDGYKCLIKRTELGFLCGYVGIPKGHISYGNNEVDIECHGGITYSDYGDGITFPKTYKRKNLWWIGFDCGHAGDLMPYIPKLLGILPPSFITSAYRDINYVQENISCIVKQLNKIKELY